MNSMKKYDQIQDLVGKGINKQALEILKERAREGGDLLDAALIRSGTYANLQNGLLNGVVDPEQAEISMNKISAAILDLNDTIEEVKKVKDLKAWYRKIILTISLALIGRRFKFQMQQS